MRSPEQESVGGASTRTGIVGATLLLSELGLVRADACGCPDVGAIDVREIVLRNGLRLAASQNYPVLAVGEGGFASRPLRDIRPSDYVAFQLGRDLWPTGLSSFEGFMPAKSYGNQKRVNVPTVMTSELGFLLGAYAAEGHTTRSNWTVTITNACDDVLHRVVAAWQSEFGVVARIAREPDRCPGVLVSSKTIVEFLDYLGAGSRASNKRIPDAILRSPRSIVVSFLQGLSLDAYVTVSTAPKWAICLDSPKLLDDLQVLLANLGVMNGRVAKFNREYDKDFGEVYVTGEYAQWLAEMVPFMEPEKAARADELRRRAFQTAHATADVVPGVAPRALFDLLPPGARNEFRFLCDRRTLCSTRRSLERVAAVEGVVLPAWLGAVLRDGLYFSPVASVANLPAERLYDVTALGKVVVNGIVSSA